LDDDDTHNILSGKIPHESRFSSAPAPFPISGSRNAAAVFIFTSSRVTMSARGGKCSAFSASASHRASFGSHKASTAAVDAVKLNPFERLKQRAKFDVMGRTLKGTQRANGQARSRAIQKRKESLLVELQQDGKRNQFIDHRFGEGDDTITADDRMLQRFQKERQTKSKKFNLDVRHFIFFFVQSSSPHFI
jgi:hypothetical protein